MTASLASVHNGKLVEYKLLLFGSNVNLRTQVENKRSKPTSYQGLADYISHKEKISANRIFRPTILLAPLTTEMKQWPIWGQLFEAEVMPL